MLYTIKVPLITDHWEVPPFKDFGGASYDFIQWEEVIDLSERLSTLDDSVVFLLDAPIFQLDVDLTVPKHFNVLKSFARGKIYTRIFNIRLIKHPLNPNIATFFGDTFVKGVHYTVASSRFLTPQRVDTSPSFGTGFRTARQPIQQFPDKKDVSWDLASGKLFKQMYQSAELAVNRAREMGSNTQSAFVARVYSNNGQEYFPSTYLYDYFAEHLGIEELKKVTYEYGGTLIFRKGMSNQTLQKVNQVFESLSQQKNLYISLETLEGDVVKKWDNRLPTEAKSVVEMLEEADIKLREALGAYGKDGKSTSDVHTHVSLRKKSDEEMEELRKLLNKRWTTE